MINSFYLGNHFQYKKLYTLLCLSLIINIFALTPGYTRGPQSVADVAEPLMDSVVNIATSQAVKGAEGIPLPKVPKGSPFEELFEDFFNKPQNEIQKKRVTSLGSAFVIDPSGLIVTNNHVIEGADEIIAKFNDGSRLKVVKILGRDRKTDLALLKVAPRKPLKAVKFGNSSKVRVGDWVMAIGNPFGLGGSLSVGVVSAKKRDIKSGLYDEFIQTDAAINRGNSGGPLFNMKGEVVGINTAIISPTGGSIGIGFSVPANTAVRVINQLKSFGETRRGWLGVRIKPLEEEHSEVGKSIAQSLGLTSPKGAIIAGVSPGSPADLSGLIAGDVILKFDNQEIDTYRALPRIVANTDINRLVDVEFLRKGKKRKVKVKVGRLNESKDSALKISSNFSNQEEVLLGVKISGLNSDLRKKYSLSKKVKGVVIVEVEKNSIAAQRDIKEGDVIIEVTQEEVKNPADVAIRVEKIKKSGRKTVLLLLSDGKGNLRFVAIPIAK